VKKGVQTEKPEDCQGVMQSQEEGFIASKGKFHVVLAEEPKKSREEDFGTGLQGTAPVRSLIYLKM